MKCSGYCPSLTQEKTLKKVKIKWFEATLRLRGTEKLVLAECQCWGHGKFASFRHILDKTVI